MAYSGSTVRSSAGGNPPVLLARAMGPVSTGSALSTAIAGNKQGTGVWIYNSTNATTDLIAANFFTDGLAIGMKVGDQVMGYQFSSAGSSVVTFHGTIVSVTTAGASLSSGGLITSTFNST